MPRRTKEEAAQTRKTLIHAALNLFSENGVAHTTLTDISKAAGVTKGAFYWHFKNKLEIFEAIVQEIVEPVDLQSKEIVMQASDPLQGLFDSLSFYLKQVEQSEALKAFFTVSFFKCEYTQDLAPLLKFDQQEMAETQEMVTQLLKQLPQDKWANAKPQDCTPIAIVLIDTVVGCMMRWCRDREGTDSEKGKLEQQTIVAVKIILTGAGVKV